jgi:hypothetical protein
VNIASDLSHMIQSVESWLPIVVHLLQLISALAGVFAAWKQARLARRNDDDVKE